MTKWIVYLCLKNEYSIIMLAFIIVPCFPYLEKHCNERKRARAHHPIQGCYHAVNDRGRVEQVGSGCGQRWRGGAQWRGRAQWPDAVALMASNAVADKAVTEYDGADEVVVKYRGSGGKGGYSPQDSGGKI